MIILLVYPVFLLTAGEIVTADTGKSYDGNPKQNWNKLCQKFLTSLLAHVIVCSNKE